MTERTDDLRTYPAGVHVLALAPPGHARRHQAVVKAALTSLAALGVVVGLVNLGRLALDRPALATAIAGGLVIVILLATDPLGAATLAVPGVWLMQRLAAGGMDLSVSDALLVLAVTAAAPHVPWTLRPVRHAIGAVVAFQAILFVTVLAHPDVAGLIEWGHRLFLTGGALVVGAALAATGRSGQALRLFLVVAAVVAAAAAIASAASGFAAAELPGYHKNFIGSMMVAALVVSYLAPQAASLSSFQIWLVRGLCGIGLLASQSRGAIVALLAGLIVACVRSPEVRRRSKGLLVLGGPMALFAFFSLRAQKELQLQTGGSSFTERERFWDQAVDAWRASPLTGQGMRFFELGQHELVTDPHNVIVASLGETGLVGLVALMVLLGGVLTIIWKVDGSLAVAALAILVARFVHGLFDIFWVAGTQPLPWFIVGMALAGSGGDGPLDQPVATADPDRPVATADPVLLTDAP